MQPTGSDPPAVEQDPQPEQNRKDLLASDLASLTLGCCSAWSSPASVSGNAGPICATMTPNSPTGSSSATSTSAAWLPARYQRGYSEPSQELILGLLASARSIDGVRRSLRRMGVSVPEADPQHVVDSLVEELALLNTRTLETDCLVVFMDAKHIDMRSGKRPVRAAVRLRSIWASGGRF